MAIAEVFRVFVAIYRAGSVSGAARERHLTQPAVSAQLATLEARVGEALFIRTPRGVVPTERGKLLYAAVADAVDRLDNVARSLRVSRLPSSGTPLRLGSTPEFLQGTCCRVWATGRGHCTSASERRAACWSAWRPERWTPL